MLRTTLARAALVLAGLGLALVLLEGTTRLVVRLGRGEWFSATASRASMSARARGPKQALAAAGPGEYSVGAHEVIHPYLGFVPDPAALPDGMTIGDPQQIPPRSDRHLNVALFGGSFAAGICNWARNELKRILARPGKEVRPLCLAAGGYKQPQQLLTLTFLLAQGAHFDLVINIDGFNEVALPPDNVRQRVAPIYPRSWFWRIGNVPDPSALKLLGALATLEQNRQTWLDIATSWRFDRSALLSSIWQRVDQSLEQRRTWMLAEIQSYKLEQRTSYAATGPEQSFPDAASLYAYLAQVWADSSSMMQSLCTARGIEYAHFLQPNQYVAGSKPMGPEEQRFASGRGPYWKAVTVGYPFLRQRGEALRRAGVAFEDLTMAFEHVTEPLYNDGCCHLSPKGYIMIARAIGDRLRMPPTTGAPLVPSSSTPER